MKEKEVVKSEFKAKENKAYYEIIRPGDRLAFKRKETLLKEGAFPDIMSLHNSKDYDVVFKDVLNLNLSKRDEVLCDELFILHNSDNRPAADCIYSMSVGDVIHLCFPEEFKAKRELDVYYFVDSIGFSKLE